MTNTSIPEEARRVLQSASNLYEESTVSEKREGPWPDAGDHDFQFAGFLVTMADFYYPGPDGSIMLPNGTNIQCTYHNIDETGEPIVWKGSPAKLPPNFKETMQLLAPKGGQNSQASVSFGLARMKAACQYILGRPASPDFLADIQAVNDLIDSGEVIGVTVRVDAQPWKSDATKMNHTDYVNGTVHMASSVITEPVG